jgi:hypothetical protein
MRSSLVHELRRWAVLAALAAAACGESSSDTGCALFAGTWSLSTVPWAGVANLCYGSRSWSLSQTGCTVTVAAPSDPANDVTGNALGDKLHLVWSWTPSGSCAQLVEHMDMTLVGSGMTADYWISETDAPPCSPSTITCKAHVTAVRLGP